jgi:transposase
MVSLYNNGKPRSEIIREYDLTPSPLAKWINYYNNTGSFKEADNRSEEEKKLLELEKENRQLKMENDILKQAALIMGRK